MVQRELVLIRYSRHDQRLFRFTVFLALARLIAHIGHKFNHHDAQSDAETAGRVLLAMMKHGSANTPSTLLQQACIEPIRFCQ
jgi:hypothetical protein